MRSSPLKSKKNLVEGRSFPINLFLVLTHVVLVVLCADSFLNGNANKILQLSFGLGVIFATVGLVILKGFYMYSYVARFGLALVLIISGFGKLNDPVGFAEILRDYFQDGALNVYLSHLLGWKGYSLASYSSSALTFSVLFAIGEILLSLMLLFNLMYKAGVWLTSALFVLLSVVSSYNYNCDISFDKNQTAAGEPHATITSSQQPSGQNATNNACLEDKGHFGPDQQSFLGIENSSTHVLIITLMLMLFSVILMITQFWILPNSPGENTAFGILLWLFILAHGIISSWFWLVFLSAIIIYLALNFKRFSIVFLKSSFATLLVLSSLLLGLVYYIISYEPLSDFRTYAIGNDLKQMVSSKKLDEKRSIYVYRDKRNNKERFLDEDEHSSSNIWEDSNFVFDRVHDLEVLQESGEKKGTFNPLLNVRHHDNQKELNLLIQPVYEAYFEDLVQVKNNRTKEISTYRKSDFPAAFEADTNYTVLKFSGLPEGVDFISAQELILGLDLVYVWVVKDAKRISKEDWGKIRELNKALKADKQDVIIVGYQDIDTWEKASMSKAQDLAYLNLTRKEILKISRSNLSLMILKNGVVSGKYPLAGLPKYETIKSKLK